MCPGNLYDIKRQKKNKHKTTYFNNEGPKAWSSVETGDARAASPGEVLQLSNTSLNQSTLVLALKVKHWNYAGRFRLACLQFSKRWHCWPDFVDRWIHTTAPIAWRICPLVKPSWRKTGETIMTVVYRNWKWNIRSHFMILVRRRKRIQWYHHFPLFSSGVWTVSTAQAAATPSLWEPPVWLCLIQMSHPRRHHAKSSTWPAVSASGLLGMWAWRTSWSVSRQCLFNTTSVRRGGGLSMQDTACPPECLISIPILTIIFSMYCTLCLELVWLWLQPVEGGLNRRIHMHRG